MKNLLIFSLAFILSGCVESPKPNPSLKSKVEQLQTELNSAKNKLKAAELIYCISNQILNFTRNLQEI